MKDNRQLPHSKNEGNQILALVPRFSSFEETFDSIEMKKLYADDPLAALLLEGAIPDGNDDFSDDDEDDDDDDQDIDDSEINDDLNFEKKSQINAKNSKLKSNLENRFNRHELFNLENDLIDLQQNAIDQRLMDNEELFNSSDMEQFLRNTSIYSKHQNSVEKIENKIQKLEKYLQRMKYLLDEIDLVDEN